ncbi:hypothetical protein E5676_scaffold225G00350 [Cucumis melo var. makuwa]|uniref:Ty3-gypsy retrotransposon protein n=1 Tax=Cucumis melo var. makuwa TaxID=1194695 RepID=A0A5D3DVJ9_CUCMM|nr:hypothetical protein E5676_scaffold225G00350 [Cucumis melo var. makuwa]
MVVSSAVGRRNRSSSTLTAAEESRGVSSRRVGLCAILRSQLRAEATSFELLSSSSTPIRHPLPRSVVDHWSSPPPGQRHSLEDRVLSLRRETRTAPFSAKPNPTHAFPAEPLDQVILERGISPVKGLFVATSTSDMIQVVRRDRSQPDCLSVSSGYTTHQFVLGVPLGLSKTSYVPPGSHVTRVWEHASSWVPLFRTLIGNRGKGKGKGKLTNDQK